MVWSKDESGKRTFDSILSRGSKIPATSCKTFQVETDQKFLSLDIYEELDIDYSDASANKGKCNINRMYSQS